MFRKKSPPHTIAGDHHAAPFDEPPLDEPDPLDRYVVTAPSAQNALDLFAGNWYSALPSVLGLEAGTMPFFDDPRIKAVLRHLDSIKSYKVLELGPLEGGHTYLLHEAGARVVSIEGSAKSFLKCLVVKEILNLNRAHFVLGDFMPYLETTNERFDLVVASGVLHHSADPISLLKLTRRVADKVAIWTHYWDADAMASNDTLAPLFRSPAVPTPFGTSEVRLHPRYDDGAVPKPESCCGPHATSLWFERDDLFTVLSSIGLSQITVLDEDLRHPNGPAILLCAER